MTWALRSFIFNHQLFPSPTVLARNVVRQQGRGNDGAISVLSTPKGGVDKHFFDLKIWRPEDPATLRQIVPKLKP